VANLVTCSPHVHHVCQHVASSQHVRQEGSI
jgi:hypothetical protein